MSKTPGLFGTGKNTIVNTVVNIDKTVNSSLGMLSTSVVGIANYAGEFTNDSSQDLVTSRVNLAKGNAKHRTELKALGYDDATIDSLLSVEIH